MPLFRRKGRSQADRLAAWRLERIEGPSGFDGPLGELLDDLELPAERERRGWLVPIDGSRLAISWIDEDRVLSGWVPVQAGQSPVELAELLRRNLDPWLVWFSDPEAEGPGSVGARFKLPLDGFDRGAVLLALESIAGLLGDDELATRIRRVRVPAGGEMVEQADAARVRQALGAGLAAVELPAGEDPERERVWSIEVERGAVEAVVRDTGESVLFLHQLKYTAGEGDAAVLRWLLQASDWSGARLGLTSLPGGPGLFAACSIAASALEPQALAWAVEQVLRVSDDYDARSTEE